MTAGIASDCLGLVLAVVAQRHAELVSVGPDSDVARLPGFEDADLDHAVWENARLAHSE